MHWLDILLLSILGIGALLGAWSGLLWQIARIVTFGVAIYVTIDFHEPIAGWLGEQVQGLNEVSLKLLAYVGTFVGIYIVFYTATWLAERALKAAHLKVWDRVLGALAGSLKFGLVAGAILLGLAVYGSESIHETLNESQVAPVMLSAMRGVIVAVPQQYRDEFGEALDKLKEESKAEAEKRLLDSSLKKLP